MSKDIYSNNSISTLKDEQQVRQRPAVIFGTNDIEGCAHSILEIIANSVDEVREGFGSKLLVKVDEDNVITVQDNGRGVPMDWNEAEGKYNWELVFCTLYASGKYDDSNYESSLGLNGLGATATQYASEFMRVESIRDNKKYTMNFEKGRPVGELKVEEASGEVTGTTITFKPDREVFTGINVPLEYYLDVLRRQAMIHRGLDINLQYKGNDIDLYYENGAKDFIELICDKRMGDKIISFEGEAIGSDGNSYEDVEYRLKMTAAFTFSRELALIEMYHNSSHLSEGGTSYDGMTSGITKVIDEYAKQEGKLSKRDKIQFKDIEEILVFIGTTDSPASVTSFKHQTKTAISNKFIRKAYNEFIIYNLSRWMNENKSIADKIVDEVLLNKKARESADAVKKKVIRKLSTTTDNFAGRPEKFTDCASNIPSERELYIVEGDSAKGSCVFARNGKFQAIMPIRGKIMNCLKEDLTKILNSEIIVDLMRVMQCGIEAESKYVKDLPKFDINKLNYGKIIICTDADLDGMQIRCLIITMLYRLVPTLLEEGKVFIAETPLYEINVQGESIFAYNENEKEELMKELYEKGFTDRQIKIERSKGLGENDAEMMALTTMNPETRRLIQVEYNREDKNARRVLESLLGDDIESRRHMIEQYFDMEVLID